MASGSSRMTGSVIERILSIFPKNTSYCFAYGSGVFQQSGYDKKRTPLKDSSSPMLDFVFATDDPLRWHQTNLQRNPKHYASLLRVFGARTITALQQSAFGARVYYNTLVSVDDHLVKYGVVSTSALITDLLDWDTLYLSGRMHKPVLVLRHTPQLLQPQQQQGDTMAGKARLDLNHNVDLRSAVKRNLHSALHCALLLLPETFSEESLYCTIARISYIGDFRMTFGENRNKVENIVRAQMSEFRRLYRQPLSQFSEWAEVNNGKGEQDSSTIGRLHHLSMLPKHVQLGLCRQWNRDGRERDLDHTMQAIANDFECPDFLHRAIREIVVRSSITQSLKGIATAGVWKSLRYSARKIGKMFTSSSSSDKSSNGTTAPPQLKS